MYLHTSKASPYSLAGIGFIHFLNQEIITRKLNLSLTPVDEYDRFPGNLDVRLALHCSLQELSFAAWLPEKPGHN